LIFFNFLFNWSIVPLYFIILNMFTNFSVFFLRILFLFEMVLLIQWWKNSIILFICCPEK
jgi:hypothetical protein